MIKFKASWIASIKEYPCESETAKTVTIGYDRMLRKTVAYKKETQEEKFCDTFEEAKQFLINKHERKVREMEKALEFCKENLELARSLTIMDVEK